jgi:putative transposase
MDHYSIHTGMGLYSFMVVKKSWHCAYDIHYHFVFVVKYRKSLLDPEVVEHLKSVSQEIAARYEIEIETLGTDDNHIHLLCSAHPKLSPGDIVRIYKSIPGDIVRIYKSITARELFKRVPALKQELWGGQFWTDGYFVATVGQRGGYQALVRYITNQGQKPEAVNLKLLFPPQ